MKTRIIVSLSIIIAMMTTGIASAQDNRDHFQQDRTNSYRNNTKSYQGTRHVRTDENGYHSEKTYYGYRQTKQGNMHHKVHSNHTTNDFRHGDFDHGEEYDHKDINDHSDYNHH